MVWIEREFSLDEEARFLYDNYFWKNPNSKRESIKKNGFIRTVTSVWDFFWLACRLAIDSTHLSPNEFRKTSSMGVEGLEKQTNWAKSTEVYPSYRFGVPNIISSGNLRTVFANETSRIKTFRLISCTVLEMRSMKMKMRSQRVLPISCLISSGKITSFKCGFIQRNIISYKFKIRILCTFFLRCITQS